MKILVIGLGSMGKRRIRNLKALNFSFIDGFDVREDRRVEAVSKYNIRTYADFEQAITENKYDAFIISVPPDIHHIYMKYALSLAVPFFVEASVVDDDLAHISNESDRLELLAAPSSTMFFHPAIKKIKELLQNNIIGNVTHINYQSGQYLPDWHAYENVSDFYVSNKSTGGAREIVPFELTWIVALFGFPKAVTGFYKKTIYIEGADEIDDTYSGLFDYEKFVLSLTVDVVSRAATRKLLINGSIGQMQWDWNDDHIDVYTESKGWYKETFERISAEKGYNENITEQMYIDEMSCFFDALSGKSKFVNCLSDDLKVLNLLYALEKSNDTGKLISV